jgi:hypothetical protein
MINLMFAFKCLLLNIEYVLMYVPKALAAIFTATASKFCPLIYTQLRHVSQKTCHVTATEPFHWRSGCCLQKPYVTLCLPTVMVTSLHLRGSVFTGPLPRGGLHIPLLYCCVLDRVHVAGFA